MKKKIYNTKYGVFYTIDVEDLNNTSKDLPYVLLGIAISIAVVVLFLLTIYILKGG